MKQQLKLWRVILYEKNPHSMNDVPRAEVVMLGVHGFDVMALAKEQMGYLETAHAEIVELEGPFDSGYLISFKSLTDMPQATKPKTANSPKSAGDVIDEFEALFSDEAMARWNQDD